MEINYGNYPLRDIPAPHPHDVLCGRGGGTNNHIGNSHWRMLVAANKQLYITLPKRQKMLLSRSIVNAVRSQQPPGRFLQKNSKTNTWFDVGDQRAQEKTSQALREGAPDIRNKAGLDGERADAVESTDETTTTTTDSGGEQADHEVTDNAKNHETVTRTAAAAAHTTEPSTTSVTDISIKTKTTSQESQEPSTTSVRAASPCHSPSTTPAVQVPHMANNNNQSVAPSGSQGNFPFGMPGGFQYFAPGMGGVMPPQGMILFAGPNMQPVQVFPTMVMNEHGMMVPGMSMVPAGYPQMATVVNQNCNFPIMMPPPMPQVSAAGSAATEPASNIHEDVHETDLHHHHPQQQYHHQYYQPLSHNNKQSSKNNNNYDNAKTPTFDEFVAAAPPDDLDGAGFSFGSAMTDTDPVRLLAAGTSFGTIMSYKHANNDAKQQHLHHHQQHQEQYHHQQQQYQDDHAPIVFGTSLEPTGISFGDASMTSVGTKLETGGTSYGTMMSLEQIGTSFGSLSLEPKDREMLFQRLEFLGGGKEIPPMFPSEAKATGNLLDCSDTESEEEQLNKPELIAQKSQAWDKMQRSVAQTQLHQSQSKDCTVNSADLMPPPNNDHHAMNGTVMSIPTTIFQRDFSQLSAWGDDCHDGGFDDAAAAAASPPQLEKQESDEGETLIGYLSQQRV